MLDGTPPANTAPVRSLFEPGQWYKYSDGGITISQLLLTDITGKPYDRYMWKHELKPLGMNNSSFTPPASYAVLLSSAYYPDGNEVNGKYHIYPEQAAAGFVDHTHRPVQVYKRYTARHDRQTRHTPVKRKHVAHGCSWRR